MEIHSTACLSNEDNLEEKQSHLQADVSPQLFEFRLRVYSGTVFLEVSLLLGPRRPDRMSL
jgi:hypothetical protein